MCYFTQRTQPQSQPYYSPSQNQPISSEAPDAYEDASHLICEVPDDSYKSTDDYGRSQAQMSFIEPPASLKPSEALQAGQRSTIPESQFQSTLENSYFVADLHLNASDRDGAQNRSQGDIQGVITKGRVSLSKDLFAPAIFALKGSQSSSDDTTTKIKDVSFSSKKQSYTLKLEVTKDVFGILPIWDNFEVEIKVNKGKLVAQLDDNWFPNSKILDPLASKVNAAIQNKIPKAYQDIQFNIIKHSDKLEFSPEIKSLTVPLQGQGDLTIQHLDSKKSKLEIDSKGNMHIGLKNIDFSGSTGTEPNVGPQQNTPDKLKLHVKLGARKDKEREVYTRGELALHLDKKETQNLKIGNNTLGHYLQSGSLKNAFSLHLKQKPGQPPVLENKNYLDIDNADLGDGNKVNLQSTLQLKYDPKDGLYLDTIDYDYQKIKLNPSQNGIDLMINGENYFPEMKKMISEAKESINLETFMFTNDKTGQEVAYLLARKAAGLTTKGPVKIDNHSPQGVNVRFIFNSWKGNIEDGKASTRMLLEAREKVTQEIKESMLTETKKTELINQVEGQLKWTFFHEGILRSDHRKVMVIDGEQATVGGMNIGENYMSDHGYHDVMLKVAGPEVNRIQREFIENWHEFNQQPLPTEKEWDTLLKPSAELTTNLKQLQSKGKYASQAKVQTLVTDDQQIDIERAMVKLIDEAKSEINIQQAFFRDETINTHLEKAIKRGVNINIIVAETPLASGVFSPSNLLSAYELVKFKKEGAKGNVQLHYYGANHKGKRSQIHTKAISADGQRAIIGSANMIGRSLSSPFVQTSADGSLKQAMFNKELSLWVEDPQFVHEIDQRLFQEDMLNQTRSLNADDIEAAVKKLGGEKALRQKAFAAPFT